MNADQLYGVFNELAKVISGDNVSKGFWEDYVDFEKAIPKIEFESVLKHVYVAQKIALMHSELSEALEADRKDLTDSHLPERKGLEVELADCLIRILDFAGMMNMDIGGAVKEKLEFNRSRDFKHGKAY